MSAHVDIATKVSYLLPTGTFLTFQIIAPLATNSGNCGRTERILTAVALALMVSGCMVANFTDSFTDTDGKVHNGIVTCKGLWVPGYGARATAKRAPAGASSEDKTQNTDTRYHNYIRESKFMLKPADYFGAVLSATAFLTLTMFTDPVSSCFYPHLSETLLKTLPVLLATVLSFCCSFGIKVRNGYGNAATRTTPAQDGESSKATTKANTVGTNDVTTKQRGEDLA